MRLPICIKSFFVGLFVLTATLVFLSTPQPVLAQEYDSEGECRTSGCIQCTQVYGVPPPNWTCADKIKTQPLGPLRGIGPLGLEGLKNLSGTPALFAGVLSKIIGVLTAAAIIWFIFQFIIGAFAWISSGGDQKAVEAARSRLTNAVIGIVIVFGALVLISVIGALLGIDILNIGGFITTLTP